MADYPAFWPGQEVKLQGVWKTTASVEVDPTSITLYVEKPSGSVSAYTTTDLTKDTTGTYYYLVVPTTSETGMWTWGCNSTGTAVAANYSGRFQVLVQPFST